MEYTNMKQLIEKYFKGETTLEEEKAIRELLSQRKETANEYSEMSSYFSYLSHKQTKSKVIKLRVRNAYRISAVAAVAATVFMAFFLPFGNFSKQQDTTTQQVVYLSDLEEQELIESFEHFKSYMIDASLKLNEGTNSLAHLDRIQVLETYLESE
ncbi:MAG: hypothetical protein OXC03_05795 [Flavobacteriaceae bacterium]|nr:hypothetical protein [Flavobacteriaceae bacterium]